MQFDSQGRVLCEHCDQPNGPLYCVFPANKGGFPYLCVCKICVADLAEVAQVIKSMCDTDYPCTGELEFGDGAVVWTEQDGQLYDPLTDKVRLVG